MSPSFAHPDAAVNPAVHAGVRFPAYIAPALAGYCFSGRAHDVTLCFPARVADATPATLTRHPATDVAHWPGSKTD